MSSLVIDLSTSMARVVLVNSSVILSRARSNTKCNFLGGECCMGKIYDQLGIGERVVIQIRLEMGVKPGAIALGLGRPASTIWRELRRNG